MKKLLFMVLMLAVAVFALAACNRNGGNDPGDPGATTPPPATTPAPVPTVAPTPPPPPEEPDPDRRAEILAQLADWPAPTGHVIVATGTRLDQNVLGGWTNPTPMAQARTLMSGLGTMARNHLNDWFPNPMVMEGAAWPVMIDNPDGSRTYHFTIVTDNQFSDGTYINAMHYAGSIAFYISPQWAALVPSVGSYMWLEGRDAWLSGESDVLTGVRLYNEREFSVTARAEDMPNVWEAAIHMNFGPEALHVYGVEARDDGRGVYLTAVGGGELTFEAVHDAVNGGETRMVQLLDPDTGEPMLDAAGEPIEVEVGDGQRYRPTVFSGPYMFESIDVGNGRMTLVANPLFPGTWDGFKPRIERIIYRFTPSTVMIDALAAGEAHIMDAVSDGQVLENAFTQLVEGGTHGFFNYDQHGQRLIQFHTDTGPTQFKAVRQALSHLIDRYRINEEVGRGFSTVAHGPWGPAWWWYQEAAARDLYDRITIYDLNIDRAIQLLEEDGWIYDADGNPFVGPGDGETNIRHKWVDEWHWGTDEDGNVQRFIRDENRRPIASNIVYTGEKVLMPLVINWVVGTAANAGRDALERQLYDNLAAAGGRLVQERNDRWGAILQGGYQEEKRFEMIYLGVGMATIWAPWNLMSLEWIPNNNWGQVDNALTRELSDRFRVLDITTPEGYDAFVEAFIDYMEHLTDEAYTLPIRMALVHDFIPTWLGGWFNTGLWGLPEAIQRSYIRD